MSALPPNALNTPSGAPPSIQELVRHEPWLRRLALQIVHDPHTAEDLVQETWVAAMKGAPVRSPRSWLKRVLFNRARTHWHRETLRGDSEYRAGRPDLDESQFEQFAEQDLKHSLAQAVMELAEPYRSTLLDHYLRETPSSQIASHAGVPESTVRWRLMRGREQLRERLDGGVEGGRNAWLSGLVAWIHDEPGELAASGGLGLSGLFVALASVTLLLLGSLGLNSWYQAHAAERRDSSAALPTQVVTTRSRGSLTEAVATPHMAAYEEVAVHRVDAHELDANQGTPPEAATTSEANSSDPSLRLAVVVFDEASHTPLAGAVIFALEPDGLVERARTDENGTAQVLFEERDFHGGGFARLGNMASLRVQAPGRPWSTLHSLSRAKLQEWNGQGQLNLPLSRECSPIQGRVVDEEGLGIGGAEISVGVTDGLPQFSPFEGFFTTLSPLRTRADAEGYFEFEGVWPRPVELRARVAGRLDAVLQGDARDLAESEIRLSPKRSGRVRGRVFNRLGAPVAGAKVWFDAPEFLSPLSHQAVPGYDPRLVGFAATTIADAGGRFELCELPPGELRLWAQHPTSAELVATRQLDSQEVAVHEWNPRLEKREPLSIRLVLEEGAVLPPKPFLHLASAKQRDLRWNRMLPIPASGVVELYDWPDVLLDLYVQVELLAEAPWADVRHFRASESPIEVVVEKQRLGTLRGQLVDHLGDLGTVASLVIIDRAEDFIASARVDPLTGTFELEAQASLYEVYVEVAGRGVLQAKTVELRTDEVRELSLALPWPGLLVPIGEADEGDRGLHYQIHAHSAIGTGQDLRVLIEEGRGSPRDPIEVLPGVYSYVLRKDGKLIGGTLIPVTTGEEGLFDVRLDADPVIPIRVLDHSGPAPLGTTLFVIADEGDDPLALELGDGERTSPGLWHVQLPGGAYHVEASLPDGTVLLRELAFEGWGAQEELVLQDQE